MAYYIAQGAVVEGEVTIDRDSSVWYNATVRGDSNSIKIGRQTNIQDNVVIHVEKQYPVVIGDNVTVGHGAIVHGCSIGENTVIGMGAIVLNGAKIGKDCIIGAGSLVTQGMIIEDGSVAFGNPAKIIRKTTTEETEHSTENALAYVTEARKTLPLYF